MMTFTLIISLASLVFSLYALTVTIARASRVRCLVTCSYTEHSFSVDSWHDGSLIGRACCWFHLRRASRLEKKWAAAAESVVRRASTDRAARPVSDRKSDLNEHRTEQDLHLLQIRERSPGDCACLVVLRPARVGSRTNAGRGCWQAHARPGPRACGADRHAGGLNVRLCHSRRIPRRPRAR